MFESINRHSCDDDDDDVESGVGILSLSPIEYWIWVVALEDTALA